MSPADARRLLRYLSVLLRGRPLHGRERYQPFFIVGSGRCGMTLLRAVLEAHPDVHVPPENVLGSIVPVYRRYSRLPWSALLRVLLTHFEYYPHWEWFELELGPVFRDLVAAPPANRHLAAVIDALYRAHARKHKPSGKRWGDKTPANTSALPDLHRVFPDLLVIHVVRDGRDVVRSLLELPGYDLARASGQWLRAVRDARNFGARYPSLYCEVRYESLVREPRSTIEGIAAYLGLSFDERMLRHDELGLRLGDVERLPHLQGVLQPIHATAIGRWRNDLDPAQLAELDGRLGRQLAALGYEPTRP